MNNLRIELEPNVAGATERNRSLKFNGSVDIGGPDDGEVNA